MNMKKFRSDKAIIILKSAHKIFCTNVTFCIKRSLKVNILAKVVQFSVWKKYYTQENPTIIDMKR